MESVFLPVLGLELALISLPVGACVPRGRLEPFFLLVSPALTEVLPSLFILLIISRTDLGLSLGAVIVGCFSLVSTLVTSPDLRSTPTIDQGRGLGRGLGLGLKWLLLVTGGSSTAVEVGKVLVDDRGLASGEGEAFFSRLNLDDLKPTMDPLGCSSFACFSSMMSLGVEVVIGEAENSLVGEVKLAAKPVDLLIQKREDF